MDHSDDLNSPPPPRPQWTSSMKESVKLGMREVLRTAAKRGLEYDPLEWLQPKSLTALRKKQLGEIQAMVSQPRKFAIAQQRAKISYSKASVFARALLPKGRGWRPHVSRVVAARKEIDEDMQGILPVWATEGKEGHCVSIKRVLQLVLPWYCAEVERRNLGWDALKEDGGEEWSVYGEDCGRENPLLDKHGRPFVELAVSFDGRSHGKGSNYLSCSISSKVRGFEQQWQSKDWVFLVCEVLGHDSAANMERNCLDFWSEVQDLEEGATVGVTWKSMELNFRIFWIATGDMKAQWAMLRAGGAGGNAQSGKPCQRCDCTKGEMDVVFDMRTLQPTDTPSGLAKECGAFANELRMVNNLKAEDERAHNVLQSQANPETAKFRPRVRIFMMGPLSACI
eukprot:TRINITY_DN1152_c0_g1_i3.p1 TRINITY_DN1152_c0_g1~~TRINITY_DN1152_c0_g1_i3.p1  ORF type:complete len:396 (-),score=49.05 TRINITY_DN1152_c0_g1_i3:2398-3585(-)